MKNYDLKIDQNVIFELDQNGQDKLCIIASSVLLGNFLSHFPILVNQKWDAPSMYYSVFGGVYNKNKNIFDAKADSGHDQLSIITKVDKMINFFSCLVVPYSKVSCDTNSNYLLKYKGTFIEQHLTKKSAGALAIGCIAFVSCFISSSYLHNTPHDYCKFQHHTNNYKNPKRVADKKLHTNVNVKNQSSYAESCR